MFATYTVYDIIEVLRLKNNMSSRRLAIEANVSVATLASLINRQPPTIAIETLDKISNVFGVKWYELLNKPASYENEFVLEKRVSVYMTQDDILAVGERLTGDYSFMAHVEKLHRLEEREQRATRIHKKEAPSPTGKDEFKNSLFFVLNKLNEEGLMEAMRRILDVANDPKYCKNNEIPHDRR